MTNDSHDHKPDHPRSPHFETSDEELSLQPLVQTLRAYRRIMGVTILGIMFAVGVVLLGAYLLLSSARVVGLPFELVFEGADRGIYPNGEKFNTEEITAPSVISEVYAANQADLSLTPGELGNALFVFASNPDIDMLTYEYQGKLSDSRLSPVDRARLEDEFRRRLATLNNVGYSLHFRWSERIRKFPTDLAGKLLGDVLTTWARQAEQRRGVLKYDIPIYSRNTLQKELLFSEEPAIAADMLRAKARRIESSIDKILELPGAGLVHTGTESISLSEIRANLEDIVRFKLQPVVSGVIADQHVAVPHRVALYFETQLLQVRLDNEEAERRVDALQQSLREYTLQKSPLALAQSGNPSSAGRTGSAPIGDATSVIPQFSESFLDRLVEFAGQNDDADYRQQLTARIIDEQIARTTMQRELAYYQQMSTSAKTLGRPAAASLARHDLAANGDLDDAFKRIALATDQVMAIYEEISTHNLNPATMLYRVTGPFTVVTERQLSVRTMALALALVFLLALLLVPIGCLLHAYYGHATE